MLPPGATLLGVILSSDKTTISAMTGNRMAHPLLISLANLDMDFRGKVSHHAFLLLALLPIPKFLAKKKIRGALESRLIHECLDFVLAPLKKAAEVGVLMSDPLGQLRFCFTPLASYIVDTPESALLAGVAGKTSSVTMASYKQFGDPFRHEPRTSSTTLAQLQALEMQVDPWNLHDYVHKAKKKYRLNGVHRPFWRDWPLAEPSTFLTPEPLHHLHKQFWDHDVKWCIRVLGNNEIDFRFSVLPPWVGFRHFNEGISRVQQVTGRTHRDVQRYLVSVIAGAVPKRFLIAIRALMEFRYLVQAPEIDDDMCTKITAALQEFHDHKSAILDAGARVGKKGKTIDVWAIPKLEFMQSVVSNILANGPIIQWSADVTEHAHITEIKDPARSGNNQRYEEQICRSLDRTDKCRRFDLATSVREARVDFRSHIIRNNNDNDNDDNPSDLHTAENISTTASLLARIQPTSNLSGPLRVLRDYFAEAESLKCGDSPNAPQPFRTFACESTAYHLNYDADYKHMPVDEFASIFNLPDLRPALADYLHRVSTGTTFHSVGSRRSAKAGCELPFTMLQVWSKVQIQSRAYHKREDILPPQTANACPRSD
jgi:hypothetical protein